MLHNLIPISKSVYLLNTDKLLWEISDWCYDNLGPQKTASCWYRYCDETDRWRFCFGNEQAETLFVLRWV